MPDHKELGNKKLRSGVCVAEAIVFANRDTAQNYSPRSLRTLRLILFATVAAFAFRNGLPAAAKAARNLFGVLPVGSAFGSTHG